MAVCGIIFILIPLYKVSKWLLIPQIILSLFFLKQSGKLFSTWKDKKLKYKILIEKNKKEFRPDTFKVFMQAPCGRLLTKIVLKDLGIREKYKELLVYKEPFIVSIKKGCLPSSQKTIIYINEDFR